MNVPKHIKNLNDLVHWVLLEEPKKIEITSKSSLMNIREFKEQKWKYYRGIKIVYKTPRIADAMEKGKYE